MWKHRYARFDQSAFCMKSFRTLVAASKRANWNHSTQFEFEGSCFAENIKHSMQQCGYNCNGGHHGILFHPLAIAQSIDEVLMEKKYTIDDLILSGKKWVSLSHHGSFSDENAEALVERINTENANAAGRLIKADVLVVTFGTSWAWRHLQSNRVVGNCHRLPQQEFSRELSSLSEMTMKWIVLLGNLLEKNTAIHVVFTVSPVRHTREGMEENNLSKSQLRLLCHELTKAFPASTSYFPSYEIMMDDLRDYRFYEADMIHPNSTAIEYIRDQWAEAYVSESSWKAGLEIEQLNKFLHHRPSTDSDATYQEKRTEIQNKIEALIKG